MAVETRILCDCCGEELGGTGVTDAVTMTYIDPTGLIHTLLFCIKQGCGANLVEAAAAQRKKDHTRRKNVVPDIQASALPAASSD